MENKIIFTQIPLQELKEIIGDCVRNELQKDSAGKITSTDELIKAEDAIKILKISKKTLFIWRKSGRIPFYRISSRIYFKKSELLDSLKSISKRRRGE